MSRLRLAILLLGLLCTVPAYADTVYTVTFDTTALVGNGPFTLDLQFIDGTGSPGDLNNNTVTLGNFSFGGGSAVGGGTAVGGASGSLLAGVTLHDTSFFNGYLQDFQPGTQLKFDVSVTNVFNPSGTPDLFTVAILASSDLELATTGFADEFVAISLEGGLAPVVTAAGSTPGAQFQIAAPSVQAPQSIIFTSSAPSAATVGGATYNVAATGGASGNPVTFSIDATASTVCSIVGSTVSFIGIGTCVIDADQAGNVSYTAAPQAQQSFAVGQGSQSIIFTSSAPSAATVGGAPYNVTATGGGSGNLVTFSIDATAATVCSIVGSTVSFIGVGTCVIDAGQAGNANYAAAAQVQQSFTVSAATNKISQSITFNKLANKTMLQSPVTVSATASSGLPVTFTTTTPAVCTAGGANGETITLVAKGTCTVQANQAGDAVYAAAIAVNRSFTVSQVSQTITFDPLANKTMLQSPVTVSATASSGLPVTFTTTTPAVCTAGGTNGETITLVAKGTCTVQAQAGNAVYATKAVKRSFTVSRVSQTITFDPLANKTLDQSPVTVSATASSGLPVTFTTTTPAKCTAGGANGETITLVAKGTCTVKANQAGNAIYNPATAVKQSFVVS